MLNELKEFEAYVKTPKSLSPRVMPLMLTDDFIYNYPNDSKLKPILNQAIR